MAICSPPHDRRPKLKRNKTHLGSQTIKLFINIHLPPVLSNPQLFLFGQLPHFTIVPLVPERRSRSQKEGAGEHAGEEGKAEEHKRVVGKRSPVGGSPRVLVRGGTKLVRLKSWHYCGDQIGENATRVSMDNGC